MLRLKPEMHGLLTKSVIDALFSKKIYSVANFLESEIKQIAIISDLSHKDILSIRKHLINKNSAMVRNGLNYYKELIEKTAILSTGIEKVDTMLQGGLTTGNVYELCGLPVSGKTQFCLTLTINIIDKLNQFVYYIDTKRDFNGKKIMRMLENRKLSTQTRIANIMSKILVKQISEKYELINCLYHIRNEMDNGLKLRLIVIDSLPAVFYDTDDVSKTYGVMNQFVNIMFLIAKEYHVVFVVTNVMTTWYEGNFGIEKPLIEKIGLGKYWFSVPNTRIMIKQREEKAQYVFSILKCNNKILNCENCIVSLTNSGMI